MGWTSYNKYGEVILSADTLDGFSSEDFVFKAGDVMVGALGIELAGGSNFYVKNTVNNQQGRLTENALEFGVSGYDWSLQRASANVAQLGANDKIRDTSDPVNANDLSRKAYIDAVVAAVISSGAAMPTGTLMEFAGSTAPTGFLICDGSEVLRSSYTALDSVIGTTYGAYTNGAGGAGTTHMRLPDFRGRTSVGAGTGAGDNSAGSTGSNPNGTALTARARGAWGGGETHILTPAQTPLRAHTHSGTTGSQSADHTHTGTTGTVSADHTHSGTTAGINANHNHSGSTGGRSAFHQHGPGTQNQHVSQDTTGGSLAFAGGGTRVFGTPALTGNDNVDHAHGFTTGLVSNDHAHSFSTGGISANHTHTVTTGGVSVNHTHNVTTGNPSVAEANGAAHTNVQPFLVVNKIIKT
jgi:microcystin-dependent protein